jgi:uncharacterized membrane protein
MPILNFNDAWMFYNLFLAFLAVSFGYLFLRATGSIVLVVWGILWILFLPNTAYILTDIIHFVHQWPLLHMPFKIILLLQYIVFESIGLATFLLAFLPFEKIIHTVAFLKTRQVTAIILFNFVIAFGIVLGRVERVNSWHVFTQPLDALNAAFALITSVDLLGLILLLGLFCNFFYFLFRDRLLQAAKKRLPSLGLTNIRE